MTRKRGTAFRAALIASLAVAFGVGSSALATTPPSEPAGGGGECPRDIAAAAAAETTVPQTTAAPATTAAAAPETTAAAAPETTAAPATTAPPATLPENVTELDAETHDRHQPAAARRPAAGWHAPPGGRFARRELEPRPPRRQRARLRRDPRADVVLRVASSTRGQFHARTPTSCSSSPSPRTTSSTTYTLNPEAVWHSGDPITVADWQADVERR